MNDEYASTLKQAAYQRATLGQLNGCGASVPYPDAVAPFQLEGLAKDRGLYAQIHIAQAQQTVMSLVYGHGGHASLDSALSDLRKAVALLEGAAVQ